jgi:hypothetical protein
MHFRRMAAGASLTTGKSMTTPSQWLKLRLEE